MTPELTVPFFQDWKFWSFAVSFAAIVLSQMPPIHLLIRPRRLDVEVHSRIQLMHRVGNTNVGLVVGITNSGGRALRIRAMRADLTRDGRLLASLPGMSYFETPSSTATVLFVPFLLKPNESWSHGVCFFNAFDRQTEKTYRSCLSRLKADIRQKLDAQPSDRKEMVEAEPEAVSPFAEMFNRFFNLEPGEYTVSLTVTAEPGSASYSKKYRFTLFESDTEELRAQSERYKFGTFIAFDDPDVTINIPLTEDTN
ncbi:hypothetical protein [Pseudomonas sp.]|uniref:hypothetical protein n=1 Tax=Pseudomonas sp. TaxID=306 RepID=UPI0028B03493|nr:hypothetical protein [Pseudomonas sp.]